MKTITQQLNIKKFPFRIKDDSGNKIYIENSNGDWIKSEYDDNGNQIYFENSPGYWYKREYDSNGYRIYFEDNSGYILDKRPKQVIEVTLEDVAKAMKIDVKQLRIKD